VSKLKDEEVRYVEGQHEGIVSESLFHEVQEILDGRKRLYKTKKGSTDLQLRGCLICPICGRLLTGSASKGRSERYSYYHCVSPCKTRFRANNVNEFFAKELRKYLPCPGMTELYKEVLNQSYKQNTKGQRETKRDKKWKTTR